MLFVDWEGGNSYAKVFYFVFGLGHEAVIIFFVLSGFFISKSVERSLGSENFWPIYTIDRVCRITVVLIPAVFLTAVVDSIGLSSFEDSYIYTGSSGSSVITEPVNILLVNTLANGFLVPVSIIEIVSSNKSLWSISIEFLCYFIYPIFVFIKKEKSILRLVYFLVFLLIIYFLGSVGIYYFMFWVLGLLAEKYENLTKFSISSMIVLLTIIIIGRSNVVLIKPELYDILIATFFSVFVSSGFTFSSVFRLGFSRLAKHLASIPYSMYAIHLPIIAISLCAINDTQERLEFNEDSFFIFLSVLIIIYFSVNLFWFLFERNTNKFKMLLMDRLW